ncbi:MAG: hypothetical protein Q9227_005081 [Pyrenula ochraceoflavens]
MFAMKPLNLTHTTTPFSLSNHTDIQPSAHEDFANAFLDLFYSDPRFLALVILEIFIHLIVLPYWTLIIFHSVYRGRKRQRKVHNANTRARRRAMQLRRELDEGRETEPLLGLGLGQGGEVDDDQKGGFMGWIVELPARYVDFLVAEYRGKDGKNVRMAHFG